jgi:hypothetical protein
MFFLLFKSADLWSSYHLSHQIKGNTAFVSGHP